MRVHTLAVSQTGERIAGGYSAGMVRVWDLKSRGALAEFPTVFDFGGRRLAINDAGDRVLAAARGRGGLRCYSVPDGAEVWRTSRAHAIQHVSFSSDETRVYCGQDRRPLVVLDANTGNDCAPPLKGVDALWEGPEGRVQVRRMGRRPWFHITDRDGALLARVPSVGRGVLSAAFGNDAVWAAESGDNATLRCFDLSSGGPGNGSLPAAGDFW